MKLVYAAILVGVTSNAHAETESYNYPIMINSTLYDHFISLEETEIVIDKCGNADLFIKLSKVKGWANAANMETVQASRNNLYSGETEQKAKQPRKLLSFQL